VSTLRISFVIEKVPDFGDTFTSPSEVENLGKQGRKPSESSSTDPLLRPASFDGCAS
jgi:hypothetical protein